MRAAKKTSEKTAYTLMEMMIVLILITIVAAFAVPNYQRSVERSRLNGTLNNLMVIHAAFQIRQADTGLIWPIAGECVGGCNLAQINPMLGISIIQDPAVDYTCWNTGLNRFSCSGIRSGGLPQFQFQVWTWEAPVVIGTNPICVANCP